LSSDQQKKRCGRLFFPIRSCYPIREMRTADFFYDLPPDLIAQSPAPRRDGSRLLIMDRATGGVKHQNFVDFPQYPRAGDVLVLNNSRVIPARLRGINRRTGGRFEMLLIGEEGTNNWWVLVRPGKRAGLGTEIGMVDLNGVATGIYATVAEVNKEGHRRMLFTGTQDIHKELARIGEIPLPPYISRDHPNDPADQVRYQTVYAQPPGSVAAPTAGLHFTEEILDTLRQNGVKICYVTLHVGLGTFSPVKGETLEGHVMHEERIEMSEATVSVIRDAKASGHRIFAAGTTSVRVLESVAAINGGEIAAFQGKTRIFIYPPRRFQVVDALLTNFHLPCSTLLMLVSAFAAPGSLAGRELVLKAYAEAIRERYRFFSYGDAMLLV
jgi:S-adenosylmethionine:tRNA ribosyltransferase-isomerase